MKIEMRLNMLPPTKTFQDKGISVRRGKAHIYQRRDSADIREAMRSRLIKYIPEKPLEGPLKAEIDFCYPATEKAKEIMLRNSYGWYPKATKPDCDNLSKQLLDVMQELGFYRNDSQIYVLLIQKFYVSTLAEKIHNPGIEIYLYTSEMK